MDHRCGLRWPVNAPVTLLYPPHAPVKGRMREASMSGALIRTLLVPPDLVWVRFAGGFADVEAYVVRRGRGEIAVEWLEFSPPPLRALLAPPTGSDRSRPVPLTTDAR